jgi:hypothetical protein
MRTGLFIHRAALIHQDHPGNRFDIIENAVMRINSL